MSKFSNRGIISGRVLRDKDKLYPPVTRERLAVWKQSVRNGSRLKCRIDYEVEVERKTDYVPFTVTRQKNATIEVLNARYPYIVETSVGWMQWSELMIRHLQAVGRLEVREEAENANVNN